MKSTSLIIRRGDDETTGVAININGAAVNLQGWSFRFNIYQDKTNDADTMLEHSWTHSESSTLTTLILTNEQTSLLAPGEFPCKLIATSPAGSVTTVFPSKVEDYGTIIIRA